MSSRANIKRVEVLRELNASLVEFSQTLAEQIRSAQQEINGTLEWLAERERYWRRQIEECTRRLQAAERAYAACMSQRDEDGRAVSSCSAEAAEVRVAQQALAKAQQQLNKVIEWKGIINSKISHYMSQATRARELGNVTISQASSFLRAKASELDQYLASSMTVPTSIAAFGNHGAEYRRAKQAMLRRALEDPLVSREIKGWIRNEIRRVRNLARAVEEGRSVEHPYANQIRMPYGHDAGHRIAGVDTASNLRLEDIWVNRSRWHRARRLGIEDRIR